jgi:hypothetical protein
MGILNRMNGWQRLWLVFTTLSFIGFGVLYPLSFYGPTWGERQYRESFIKDLQSPACSAYISKPLRDLVEPPFSEGGTCWHLYTSRRYGKADIFPYTIERYDEVQAQQDREFVLEGMAVAGGITLFLSALLYGTGFLIAWIRRGFAKPA